MAQITIQIAAVTVPSRTIANAKAADVLDRYYVATGGPEGATQTQQLEWVMEQWIKHTVETAKLYHKNTRYRIVETEIDTELEAINLE